LAIAWENIFLIRGTIAALPDPAAEGLMRRYSSGTDPAWTYYRTPSNFQNRMSEDSPGGRSETPPFASSNRCEQKIHAQKNGLPKASFVGAILPLAG
jgi:hypothetical protein